MTYYSFFMTRILIVALTKVEFPDQVRLWKQFQFYGAFVCLILFLSFIAAAASVFHSCRSGEQWEGIFKSAYKVKTPLKFPYIVYNTQ